MKNEALLQVKPAKTRRVSVRFRVLTACDWAVRFLGGSRTDPGLRVRFRTGPRPGNPDPLLTVITIGTKNHNTGKYGGQEQ
jgi:hypothetical protein